MSRLPTWRIVLLRLCYAAIAFGLGMFIVPRLIWLPDPLGYQLAALTCFLASLALLCVMGIFRPIAMLPVLLFELGWKFVLMLRIALPAWLAGTITPEIENLFWECVPILIYVPIIPWGIVWRRYGPGRRRVLAEQAGH